MLDIALLHSLIPASALRVYEETVSTNRDARVWLLDGASHGDTVLAARQSGGRGRLGRSFFSPEGGLYMSLILHTDAPAGTVTTLCAVAVRRAIRKLSGIRADIKWVNDLQLHGKKICGILCENAWCQNRSLGMIAGIGVNVFGNAFPPEISAIASSLYPDKQASPFALEHLAAAIREEILSGLNALPSHMEEYRESCITLGKEIYFSENGQSVNAFALGIEDDGALRIRLEDGSNRLLAAGEVSIRSFDAPNVL